MEEEYTKSLFSIINEIIDKASGRIATWTEKQILLFSESYTDYIVRRIQTSSLFATNKSINVDSAYVKVCITNEIDSERYKSIEELQNLLKVQRTKEVSNSTIPIFPYEAIENTEKGFALIGSPGSGKTTAFKYLTLYAASGKKIRGKRYFPIYLQVRDLNKSQETTIYQYIKDFFKWMDFEEHSSLSKTLLRSGKIILIIDGLDETNRNHQTKILSEIEDLQAKYPKNIYCISSRPHSLYVSLSNFTKWEIKPLDFELKLKFIDNWFKTIDEEKGSLLKKMVSDEPQILEVGSNPLLLSILCALYYNDLQIPENIDELYYQCVDGMMGGWDAFRNIARRSILSTYSKKQRKLLISYLATYLYQQNKIVFSPQDVSNTSIDRSLEKRLRKEIPDFDDLLDTLTNDFGILVQRSPNYYTFSHLSIQEFLVAEYIISSRMELNLANKLNLNEEYLNIMALVSRMLPDANDFIRRSLRYVKPHNYNSVQSLIELVKAKPVCDDHLRLDLDRTVASLLKSAIKKSPKYIVFSFIDESGEVDIVLDGKAADESFRHAFSIIAYNRSIDFSSIIQEKREERQIILNKQKYSTQNTKNSQKVRKELKSLENKIEYFTGLLIVLSKFPELLLLIAQSKFSSKQLNISTNDFLSRINSYTGEELKLNYIIHYNS